MKLLNPLLPILFLIGVAFLITSCKDDEDADSSTYTIPTTYNFENVYYNGQTQRLNMLQELINYMTTSRTMGVALDSERLLAMFANDANTANWNGTYEDSKQLNSKTFESAQAVFEALLEELAIASQSSVAGETGVSGVISSIDGTKQYLIGEDGIDHAQVIEKGLMGACIYYQATSVYFGTGKMDVDNETIEEGKGTEMEHHWDEAFGYFGVPTSFPSDLDNLKFWGNYSDKRNSILGCNQKMMDAFLKGRAAISNKDLAARDEAITTARKEWELIAVGSALHYLNSGITNFDDIALRSHALSEAIGFIYSLQFNEARTIELQQMNDLLELVAGAKTFDQMNLYNTTIQNLTSAKDNLAGYYNLDDQKDEF